MLKVYNTITGYRDADYDMNNDIDKTASFPDGLHEDYTCVPGLVPKVRRTSSSGDISRFYRYFDLAHSNRGRFFTWKHYLEILQDELRKFDTLMIMTQIHTMKLRSITSVNSEMSNYITASEFEDIPRKTFSENNKRKKRSFLRKKVLDADADSISSVDATSMDTTSLDTVSITPQKNLLKKMCSEIRCLARKTCRTAEKISAKSKYCPGCGDVKSKYCPGCGDVKDYPKPLTPASMKNKLMRSGSMTFESHLHTPVGVCETPTTSRSSRLTFAPHAGCRMKPFIKRSLMDR